MKKAIIIYESKYGNTRLVAEKIAAGLQESKKVTVALTEVKEADVSDLAAADIILVGSPNHMGRPTAGITKFIDKFEKMGPSAISMSGPEFRATAEVSYKEVEEYKDLFLESK